MTQSREPEDSSAQVNRELRGLNRRLDRLEYSQISPQEFSGVLDRIYEEIGASRAEMRAEILTLNSRFDRVDSEIGELSRKFDLMMNHITGQGNSNPSP